VASTGGTALINLRYTLLIGKPPFQTKDVKAIYKRIRENRYEFPRDKQISPSAQALIMSILNQDPGRSRQRTLGPY
jgi:polo-like kinase 1